MNIRIKLLFWLFVALSSGPVFAQFASPVTVKVGETTTSQDSIEIPISLSMSPDVHVYASEEQFLKVTATATSGLGLPSLRLPKLKDYKNFDDTLTTVFENNATLSVRLPYTGKPGTDFSFKGTFQYQACDATTCFPPETVPISVQGTIPTNAIVSTEVGKQTEDLTSDAILTPSSPGSEIGPSPSSPGNEIGPSPVSSPLKGEETGGGNLPDNWQQHIDDFTLAGKTGGFLSPEEMVSFLDSAQKGTWQEKSTLSGKGIWVAMGLILLFGLGLNLTPCILPMIPINLAIIGAGAQSSSRGRGMLLGTIYGLGMALTYGVLGLLAVLAGQQFGALNSSAWFNFTIAAVFIVLSLAMFGVFNIDFTRFRKGQSPDASKKGHIVPAFAMGIIAALLAGACVAPPVISVIVFSINLHASGNMLGLLMPFLLGIGMALPWPSAGGSISLLPKPGAWMQKIKYAFGILIFAFAGYYGSLGVSLLTTRVEANHAGWHTSLSAGLEEAQKSGRPVFVDVWASWCKNCLAMEKKTFPDPNVQAALEGFVKVKYRAEKITESPAKEVMDHFKFYGLPGYLVLRVGDKG